MNQNLFPIDHIVVLMLENRSYDHMLGYLPRGRGLSGDEYNPVDPLAPDSDRVPVSEKAGDGEIADQATHLYDMRTVYDALARQGISWTIYYGDIPQSIIVQHHGDALGHFKNFDRFHSDLENGELAAYTFIEPRYLDFFEWKANDQHAPHDIRLGEYLIAEVYDSLRASRFWDSSLLVVVYDEHGGFFDHVSPPEGVPNPDGKNADDVKFNFTRLGVRVPAILISPWVERGSVDSTLYEHASLPATVRAVFGLPHSLTARDRAANTFERSLTRRSPRGDAPLTLPVPGDPDQASHHRGLVRLNSLEAWLSGSVNHLEQSLEPLSTLQEALVCLADRLNEAVQADAPAGGGQGLNEHQAAIHAHESLDRFLKGQ
jgi:phospholipase C